MADDLDDALLSLAAGRKVAKKRSRNADSDDDGGSDADSEEQPRRKKGSSKAGAGGSKRGRKVQSDDDDDEDDGGSDIDDELFENDEDRRKLMAMTELEREMILADRAEARDKERQRKQLLQQRAVAEKVDKGRKKPERGGKAAEGRAAPRSRAARSSQAVRATRDWSDAEASDGGGKSSEEEEEFRPSSSSGESSDEEDGQAGRRSAEEEEEEEPRREEEAPARARPDRAAAPAAAAPEEAGEERRPPPPPKPAERDHRGLREHRGHSDDEEAAEEATLEELLACQVTRSQLEEWFSQPFFERDALSGCVVRMAYGPGVRDAAGGTHPGYMIMEITDIKESGRAYKFGSRAELTHKHLSLRDGMGITRTMAMANVSSKPFDEAEYERYKRHCGKVHRAPITREEAAAAAKKVEAATNYRWTSADLKVELERKRAARAAPVNPAAEKAMLKRRLELATAANSIDEVAILEEQLAALEAHIMNQSNNKRAFGMMDINKRNKQHNLTVAYKTTAAEEHGTVGDGGAGTDVFGRRATTLNIYWKTKGKGGDGDDATGAAAAAAAAAAKAAVPDKLTRAQQRMDPVELIRQLALDVDVSLLQQAAITPTLQQRVLPAKWRPAALAAHQFDLAGKSVLTIADWKRRAGEY
ncbi:hypothetical protein HYH03_003871 [Edaphochlamys debaryana]|uniref:Plus3 domain-containing protein n=1 Tax=Edaphochlamys debaryana TaxID=47281 RepID=A0A835YB93_9CHLO|nr:hypothetical protein HYH03_003871 [Edaphochlamys debaryana]|eukprot:KAG2498113.1 hypothetical protein HYH03_003871 [Edaphochlamys debaryana]